MARYFFGSVWLLGIVLQVGVSHAQVVTTNITSSGLGTLVPLVTPADGVYNITGGTRSGVNNDGPNLFHSFGIFNVGAGDVANFQNDRGLPTSNILGRVNGFPASASQIFGTIRTIDPTASFGAANLFLINPAGWVFGATAALDVGGSFHASTAHYLSFPDGRFYADDLATSVLSSDPPAAFGFLSPTAPILVEGSSLSVPEGKTLSLVGGNVHIKADVETTAAPFLSAPSGRVQIGSFASAGEAAVDGLNGAFANLGNVEISGGSFISVADVDGDPAIVNGGTVLIRGGQIEISGFSFIDASGSQMFDADFNLVGSTAGGAVIIRGGQLFIDGSTITSNTFGDVDGAGIELSLAESVSLTNGSSIGTTASADFGVGLGRGGDIQITAPQANIDGSFVLAFTFGAGNAGAVNFDVATLALTGGAGVGSLTLGSGLGGNVTVTATESLSVSGRDLFDTPTSLFTSTAGDGNAGRLAISTPSLTLDDGGTIASTTLGGQGGEIVVTVDQLTITGGATIDSHTGGTSAGGNVTVTVKDTAVIAGLGADGSPSGIFSDSCFGCTGRPGDITFETGTLTVTQGALIQSGSVTDPQGGSVTVSATDSLVISDRSGISAQADSQNVGQVTVSASSLLLDDGFISASALGSGRAGDIVIKTGTLTLARGGQITSSSEQLASGDGGNVDITANSVSISGTSLSGEASSPFSTDPSSGIFSTARSSGNAGQITVTTLVITMADGGTISVATSGTGTPDDPAGAAGNVVLNVANLVLTGGATVDSSTTGDGAGGAITVDASTVSIGGADSGLFSTASSTSTGNAGQIAVSAPTLTIGDGGRISVVSDGAGNAGNVVANVGNVTVTGGGRIDSSTTGAGAGGAINVTAAGQVEISNGGSVRADSFGAGVTGNITIAAGDQIVMTDGSISTRAVTSDGGNIVLTAPNIIRLGDSQITTSVESGSGGGGNIFIDPQFVILNGSSITANAFGGPGGSITIVANNFLTDPTSQLQASSALSTPGTVQIESPENNVAGSIAQLPGALLDASRLLSGGCSARRAAAPSSFVVAGRGGVPVDADGYLPAFSATGAPLAPVARAAEREPSLLPLAMAAWHCMR